MVAAFTAIPGISEHQAKELSSRGTYPLNSAENSGLINFANDIFIYELDSELVVAYLCAFAGNLWLG